MHFVIAYDIESSCRRNRVMNALKNAGLRVQYSVFECHCTFEDAVVLMNNLRTLIDARRDRIHMYPLCEACYFRALSTGVPLKGDRPW